MNFSQGKKIRLRALEPADAQHFIRWNLDSERGRCLDFLWPPQSAVSVQTWVDEQSRRRLEANDGYTWMIENEKGEPVGSIGTHACVPRYGTFSYGLAVAAEYQHKGYASEAILLILKYYFDELRYQKVMACVNGDNEASIRLHQKLGFQLEGTHRRMFFSKGQYLDILWFGMTVEEFHQLQS
jgi:RimJ/RimL family protein N-acetyltransferase